MKINILTIRLVRIGAAFGATLLFSLPALGDDCKAVNEADLQQYLEARGDSLNANAVLPGKAQNTCQTYNRYFKKNDQLFSKCDQAWVDSAGGATTILAKRQHVRSASENARAEVLKQSRMQKIDSAGGTGAAAVASEATDLNSTISSSSTQLNSTADELEDQITKLQTAKDAALQLEVWKSNINGKYAANKISAQQKQEQMQKIQLKTDQLEKQTFGQAANLKLRDFVCEVDNIIAELRLSQSRIRTTVTAWEPISTEATQIYAYTSTQSGSLLDSADKLATAHGSTITGDTSSGGDKSNSSGFSLSGLTKALGDTASTAASAATAVTPNTVAAGLLATSMALNAAAAIDRISSNHQNAGFNSGNTNSSSGSAGPSSNPVEFIGLMPPRTSQASGMSPSAAPASSSAAAVNNQNIGAINSPGIGSGVSDDASGSSPLKDSIRGRLSTSTSASTTASGAASPSADKSGDSNNLVKTKVTVQKGNISLGEQSSESASAPQPMGLAGSETDASVQAMLAEMKSTFNSESSDADSKLEPGRENIGRTIASANDNAAFQREVAGQNSAPLFERVHASLTKNLINGSIINSLKSKL